MCVCLATCGANSCLTLTFSWSCLQRFWWYMMWTSEACRWVYEESGCSSDRDLTNAVRLHAFITLTADLWLRLKGIRDLGKHWIVFVLHENLMKIHPYLRVLIRGDVVRLIRFNHCFLSFMMWFASLWKLCAGWNHNHFIHPIVYMGFYTWQTLWLESYSNSSPFISSAPKVFCKMSHCFFLYIKWFSTYFCVLLKNKK